MKRLATVFLALAMLPPVFGQTWEWAESIHSENQVNVTDLSVQSNGDAQITGATWADFNIGNQQVVHTADSGFNSFYIVQYDEDGDAQWVHNPVHTEQFSSSILYSADGDEDGNIYAAGSFLKSVVVNNQTYYAGTGNGKQDMLLIKYDSEGNVLWTRDTDNPNQVGSTIANHIKVGSNGSIYMAGYFNDNSVIFDDTTIYSSQGFFVWKPFISKWSADGDFEEVIMIESDFSVDIHNLELDGDNNVYIIADYRGKQVTVGDSTFTNATQDTSHLDVFWARFDENLSFDWASSISSVDDEFVRGLAVQPDGDFFISGGFGGTTLVCKGTQVTGGGQCTTTYLVSLSNSNQVKWAHGLGNDVNSWGVDLEMIDDHLQMVGMFANEMVFVSDSLTSGGATDTYFASFDSTGALDYVVKAGGENHDTPKRIGSDDDGNLYGLGYFASSDFQAGSLTMTPDEGIYLLKMDSELLAPIIIGADELYETTINVYPNPTSGMLNVESSDAIDRIDLYNVSGQRVFSHTQTAGDVVQLDLSSLPSGVFFARVQTTVSQSIQTVRFVKK